MVAPWRVGTCSLHFSGHYFKKEVSPPPSTGKDFFQQKIIIWNKTYYLSFKIFCHLWLAPISLQILLNQLVLPYLEDGSKRLSIWWFIMIYVHVPSINLISRRGRLAIPEWTKKEEHLRLSKDVQCLTNWIEEMQEYAKHIMLPVCTFWRVSARNNIYLYPETMMRNRPKFEESLQEGRLVKNIHRMLRT